LKSNDMRCPVCSGQSRTLFTKQGYTFFRCKKCKHVFISPMPEFKDILEHYRNKSEQLTGNYNLEFQLDARQEIPRIYLRILINLGITGGKLLDIGCFTGDFLDAAVLAGFESYGLEFQAEAARVAATKHKGRIYNCMIEDASKLVDLQFDVITMFDVIEHLRDPGSLFRLVRKILVPNGVVIISTPSSNSWQARIMGRYWPAFAPVEHINIFSSYSLTIMLKDFGFSIVQCHPLRKRLEIGWGICQLRNFSPGLFPVFRTVSRAMPNFVLRHRVPVSIGEIWMAARICQ